MASMPLPAKITAKQALHFAESLARGEPDRDVLYERAPKEWWEWVAGAPLQIKYE